LYSNGTELNYQFRYAAKLGKLFEDKIKENEIPEDNFLFKISKWVEISSNEKWCLYKNNIIIKLHKNNSNFYYFSDLMLTSLFLAKT
jgi:hypothetical protein